jgi:hypothetical protein
MRSDMRHYPNIISANLINLSKVNVVTNSNVKKQRRDEARVGWFNNNKKKKMKTFTLKTRKKKETSGKKS